MGCLFELLLEVIFEGIIGGYFYLMTLVAPEKALNEKARNAVKTVAATIAGILFVVFFIGIFISLSDDAYIKMVGRYMVFIPLSIILIQILLGVILRLIAKGRQ